MLGTLQELILQVKILSTWIKQELLIPARRIHFNWKTTFNMKDWCPVEAQLLGPVVFRAQKQSVAALNQKSFTRFEYVGSEPLFPFTMILYHG